MNEVASKKLQRDLEELGLDMNSSEMQVFRAVLLAAGGTSKPVTYDKISTSLESIVDKKFTKAYIYRRLNDLDEKGFIKVDTINTPRTYTILESDVANALESEREMKLAESVAKKEEITSKLKRLSAVKSQELALMLHKQLAGTSSSGDSGVIEGVENVRSTIIREFADGAKEGDTVRVLGHASTMAEGLGPGGVTELRLIQSGFRGVKVLGLLTPVSDDKLDLELITGHLAPMVDSFKEAVKTGNIQLKFSKEPINTYRIVTLNEDKMLLYLTHAKESDMAALVHREDNPGLIDDALKTFDELWETGIDVLELVQQMLKKQKS